MLCDVPHLKAVCVIGLVLAIVGTLGLSWAYPVLCDKVSDYRHSKTVQIWDETYGISASSSADLLSSSSALTEAWATPDRPSSAAASGSAN